MARVDLTEHQVMGIVAHTLDLLQAVDRNLDHYKAIPVKLRNAHTDNQIKYWENCSAALRWSMQVAQQRRPVGVSNGE